MHSVIQRNVAIQIMKTAVVFSSKFPHFYFAVLPSNRRTALEICRTAKSISPSVVWRPHDSLSVPRPYSGVTPIAASTADNSVLSVWQAEPAEHATCRFQRLN